MTNVKPIIGTRTDWFYFLYCNKKRKLQLLKWKVSGKYSIRQEPERQVTEPEPKFWLAIDRLPVGYVYVHMLVRF